MEQEEGSSSSSTDLPIALRRCKRTRSPVNYREADMVKLPRASRSQDRLYPVTILEQDCAKVIVHYIGYSSNYDEWKYEDELVDEGGESCESQAAYQPYSLYYNLRLRVKQALACGRKSSPVIKIVMSFDPVLFNGGLKAVGVPFKVVQGVQHYKIKKYQDLDFYLGSSWHYRGLNSSGDYNFVELETVDFWLRKARPLAEYFPDEMDSDGQVAGSKCLTDTGYNLFFSFVCNYGTSLTFGKDKNIFH